VRSDFNPRRPARAATRLPSPGAPDRIFQPTPAPRGRRHVTTLHGIPNSLFQPTPPARAATISLYAPPKGGGISTHAARAGGDGMLAGRDDPGSGFQPTAARAGRRRAAHELACGRSVISTHAARAGAATWTPSETLALSKISTHAAQRGRRPRPSAAKLRVLSFQPTPPARAANRRRALRLRILGISTHAARRRAATPAAPACRGRACYFQPTRRPRGRRRSRFNRLLLALLFHPRRPRGRRRHSCPRARFSAQRIFQPTAARAGRRT